MRKLALSVIATLFVVRALACSCPNYEYNFYKNISKDHLFGVVVFDSLALITDSFGYSSQVGYIILLDTFNDMGAGFGDTLLLLGADGFNCLEDLSFFDQGDTLILALWRISIPGSEQDTFGLDGACGVQYLRIHNGQHSGLTISEIKDKIFDIILPVSNWAYQLSLEVFPNPAYETVAIKSLSNKIVSVDLYDVQGHWLYRKEDAKDVIELDLSGIVPGLYLLRVETETGINMHKLIRY